MPCWLGTCIMYGVHELSIYRVKKRKICRNLSVVVNCHLCKNQATFVLSFLLITWPEPTTLKSTSTIICEIHPNGPLILSAILTCLCRNMSLIYEDPSKQTLNFLRNPNFFVQEYVPKHDGVASKLSWEMEQLEFKSENACWLYTHTLYLSSYIQTS